MAFIEIIYWKARLASPKVDLESHGSKCKERMK